MEIKSNIAGVVKTINRYDRFKNILLDTKKELVDIMTDVDDYWSVGSDEFSRLRDEIDYAKESMYDDDCNLSSQIVARQ